MNCYITYDTKTKSYGMPVFFKNDEEAKRQYALALMNLIGAPNTVDKSMLYFKKDIALYRIGEYNDENGEFPVVNIRDLVGTIDTFLCEYKSLFNENVSQEKVDEEVNSFSSGEPIQEEVDDSPVVMEKKIQLK